MILGAHSNWFNIINIKLKPGHDVRKSQFGLAYEKKVIDDIILPVRHTEQVF